MTPSQHLRFWLISFAVFCILVWLLSGVLAPFVAGTVIAYVLDPGADRLERAGLPRWLATTIMLLVFSICLIAILMLIVPILSSQLTDLIEELPFYLDALDRYIRSLIELARAELPPDELERLSAAVGQYAGDALLWVASLLGSLLRGGAALIDLVLLVGLTPIVAFYLLRDWDRLIALIDSYLPRPSADTVRSLATEVNATLNGFMRGQGAVCLILGTFYAIALTAVGLDFSLLVAVTVGILSFVPYVGSITGFVLSTGIAVAQYDDWKMWLVVAGIFLFGQAVEGNFLTPKLVGDSVNLHPVIIIFALLAGGSLFGFTGVLLAVPVAAIIGVLVRFALQWYRQSGYYGGETRLITPAEPIRLSDQVGT